MSLLCNNLQGYKSATQLNARKERDLYNYGQGMQHRKARRMLCAMPQTHFFYE